MQPGKIATVRSAAAPFASCSVVALAIGLTLPAPANAAADAPQATEVGEVVVTAMRREERLQDAPLAITATSAAKLTELHISDTSQISTVTPGLTFSNAAYVPQPTIRGVGTRGTGIGDESIVPLYIDGVYQAFLPGANLQLNNVERIEVLKGPQSTLFGRNSIGGAVNIVTRTPTAQSRGDFSVSYGNLDSVLAKAFVSGGTDKIAASLAAVGAKDGGYIRDITNGREHGKTTSYALTSRVVIKPIDRLDIDLSLSYSQSEDTVSNTYQPINGNTSARRFDPNAAVARDHYTASLTVTPYTKPWQYTGTVRVNYDASFAKIVLINAYQSNKAKVLGDQDGSSVDVSRSMFAQISRNDYHELYAVSEQSGPFQWIVGATYFHDLSGSRPLDAFNRSLATGVLAQTHLVGTVRTDSYAAYAQGSYALTDAFNIIVGGRYTQEHKDLDVRAGTTVVTRVTNSAKFDNFSPSATLQYKPTEKLNLYIKASKGFKSGLFNVNASTATAAKAVAPETLTQYEAGAKYSPTRNVRLEAAIYTSDYKNIQINARDPATGIALLENGGAEKITGGEASAFVQVTPQLSLNAGLALLHGRYHDAPALQLFVPAVVNGVVVPGNTATFINGSGKTIIKAPDVTANLGGEYVVPLAAGDLQIAGNAYYTGTSYWDVGNRFKQSPYTLVDGSLTWKPAHAHYTIALWGQNLLNAYYNRTETFSTTGDFQVPGKPRTYGVEVRYSW
ncbi:MAG: TonB-dependent receptor [Phenylobacterium sp.]|nr:TonB-dependent receptor [Phenylobacterium sp.]